MKNLKISKKLTISYAVILGLLIIEIIVSIVNLERFGTQIKTFYNGPFQVNGSASIINANFEAMQKSVFRALSNTDITITNEAIQDANTASENIQKQLPIVKEHFMGDQQIITRLESYLSELAPMRENVLNLAAENKNEEAAAYMETNNIPVIKKAQVELDTLNQSGTDKGVAMIADLQASQTRAVIVLAALGVASVLVSIIFGIYITKGITKPVSELEKAAKNLSEGRLGEASIEYMSHDELGSLADSMRTVVSSLLAVIQDESYLLDEMSTGNFDVHSRAESCYVGDFGKLLAALKKINVKLSDTLSQINQASDQVASGSDQVSSGAQALSQGATEQASSIEELAATINEISSQVNTNAGSAENANQKTSAIEEKAGASNQQMREMLSAMSDISNSSREIGKIIKTIEDIAFQTNILALNAAVEAARAGAAGKGFAVVADEVRNLASKSAEASKNTAVLIENSIKAVEHGTQIADETAQSLEDVVHHVQEARETISQITIASKQQASSIQQVTQGIDQISSVVQTNSATAEESAAASEELSGQSQMLKALVSQFRLKDSENSQYQAKHAHMASTAAYAPQETSIGEDYSMVSDKY